MTWYVSMMLTDVSGAEALKQLLLKCGETKYVVMAEIYSPRWGWRETKSQKVNLACLSQFLLIYLKRMLREGSCTE